MIWLGEEAQAFGMVGKTSKACLAENGMVSLVTCYIVSVYLICEWCIAPPIYPTKKFSLQILTG